MKIYWKPLFWNIFIRPINLIKYRNHPWKVFYCTKQNWNSNQNKKITIKIQEIIQKMLDNERK